MKQDIICRIQRSTCRFSTVTDDIMEIDITLFINNLNSTIMETMKLMFLGKELELTVQEVQNKLDDLVYENSQLELEKEELKKKLEEQKGSSDMWWNSYQDEQKRNARIRKAIEAAKTVLEMC